MPVQALSTSSRHGYRETMSWWGPLWAMSWWGLLDGGVLGLLDGGVFFSPWIYDKGKGRRMD